MCDRAGDLEKQECSEYLKMRVGQVKMRERWWWKRRRWLTTTAGKCGETQPGLAWAGRQARGSRHAASGGVSGGQGGRDFDPAKPPSDNDRQCGLSWRPWVSIAGLFANHGMIQTPMTYAYEELIQYLKP